MRFNPVDNLALTTGYEGSWTVYDAAKHEMKSVFVDVGVWFLKLIKWLVADKPRLTAARGSGPVNIRFAVHIKPVDIR